MNPSYKHLESKLRIAELTLGQWAGVFTGALLGIAWGFYLSPLPGYLTMFSALYLAAVPISAAFLASVSEFNVWVLIDTAARWRRNEGRYMPGPGSSATGYQLLDDPREERMRARARGAGEVDLGALWQR